MPDLLDAGFSLDGVWWILPLLPLAVWLAHAVYARTRPPAAPRAVRVLWLLRAASLSVLLLLLIEPVATYFTRRAVRPVLVTLIDISPSMAVQEGDSTRFGRLQEALAGDLGQHLPPGPVLAFAGTAAPVRLDSLAQLAPEGLATNLAAALRAAARATHDQRRVSGIVLLSDGGHNLGDDPVAVAGELRVPVYALGLGSRDNPDDIQIVAARGQEPAFAGRPSQLAVDLRAWGFAGKEVALSVEEDGRPLTREPATVPEDGHLRTVTLSLPPLEPGPHLLRVVAAPQSGELTPHNNQALVSLRVREQRLRVLLVGGGPDPEVAFLRRLLAPDSTLALQVAVRREASTWYGDASVPPAAGWSAYDAVLLVDPGFGLPGAADLATFVSGGGGLLLLAGTRTDPADEAALAGLLPLAAPMQTTLIAGSEPLAVAPGSASHPLGRVLAELATAGSDPWRRLPPLVVRRTPIHAVAGATVLLRAAEGDPVVVAARHGRGRVLAALGSGFWRQSLFARAAGEGTDVVGRFWRQAVRWLALASPSGRVRVSAERPVYRAGQPVAVTAQVYDELNQPLDGATVMVDVDGEGETVLETEGGGSYRASLVGLSPGPHRLHARAGVGGTSIGEAETRIDVESYTVESADLRADPELLAAVARASAGDYRPLAAWRDLADRLRPPPSLVRQESRLGIEIRHLPWLGLLVVLLAAEWLLRKRAGML